MSKVGLEVWEGEESIKTELVAPPPRDPEDVDSDEEDEDDEPEEVSTVVRSKKTLVGAVEVSGATEDKKVVLEVVANLDGTVKVDAWVEGSRA